MFDGHALTTADEESFEKGLTNAGPATGQPLPPAHLAMWTTVAEMQKFWLGFFFPLMRL